MKGIALTTPRRDSALVEHPGGHADLKLGFIADAHLDCASDRYEATQSHHETRGTLESYASALERCLEAAVDGLVLLGDVSASGDAESLAAGMNLAEETRIPVWAVSGNHDCSGRVDALPDAVRSTASKEVRLATPTGEVVGRSLRVSGAGVTSGEQGYAVSPEGVPDVGAWGDDAVVWLSHYPLISFAEEVWAAGFVYGDDLEDREEAARPLLGRSAPTIVVNGHLHLRDARSEGHVLQVSCAALAEPPFEVTFLHLGLVDGGLSVRRESVPVSQPPDGVRLPGLSPPRQEWVFEQGAWRVTASVGVP